jgi:ketosteroid isomerase-like protein
MGESDIEIVRRLYECFAARDNETPFRFYAEDVVWDARGAQILGLEDVYHGHDGIRRFWRQWLDAWEEIEFEIEDPVEEDGRVRVRVHQRNLGRGTGIWIDQDDYDHFWTLSDEKVTKVEFSWAKRA